jgi:hypothetical protein
MKKKVNRFNLNTFENNLNSYPKSKDLRNKIKVKKSRP